MRDISKFDPYNVGQLVLVTADKISKMPECSIPRKIYFAVVEHAKTAPSHQAAMIDQLLRNSSSIGLNFAEAWGKGKGYFNTRLSDSRGSAYECYEALNYIPELQYLQPECLEVCQMLDQWFDHTEKKRIEFEAKKNHRGHY